MPRRILAALEGWGRRLGGAGRRARAAEAAGRLEEAAEAALAGGDREGAARLLGALAEATAEPLLRLSRLHQAAGHASGAARRAWLARAAELTLDLHDAGALPLGRGELAALAARLRAEGIPALAARLAERAGDTEELHRSLVEAGDVEALEAAAVGGSALPAPPSAGHAADLFASGARRAALALAAGAPSGPLADLAAEITTRRPAPSLRLAIDGVPRDVVLGSAVVVGRAGQVPVHAAGVGRRHLELTAGRPPVLHELGSRHGTRLGGVALGGSLAVTGPLRLELGGAVPLELRPEGGGLRLRVAGQDLELPLGPLDLAHGRLEQIEGWAVVRRRDAPLFLGGLEVEAVDLLRGDRLSLQRHGPTWLEVLG